MVRLVLGFFESTGFLMTILSIGVCLPSCAQIINGYAQVTSVSGTTISLSNVDESGDTFENGEYVIIMQMQDDVIGANTSDNSSFGDLGAIQSAGLYEILRIQTVTESAGVPVSFTVAAAPTNTYNTGSNSLVQVITFPTFGSPDYTTTSNMSAKDWDGTTGGVLTFEVAGVLTLSHNLSVNGDGFRGAAANAGGSAGCTGGSSFRLATTANFADKGEGIYRSTNSLHEAGRAKILNGGGGGNSHNAGGGGGGNYSAGGLGGPGWPNCSPTAGGIGGLDLSGSVSASRVFMGGGGGAGEGNNGGSQNAGDGGGIILIKANEIRTTGSCGGISVTADGESVTTGSGNDGNSGGGAAGSIVFQVPTWTISATCPLTIQSDGGDGGDVTHGDIHGAGGGGGMGAILFSSAQPTTNVTVNNNPGQGGSNCTTCGSASNGGGTDGDGISVSTGGPLPVQLSRFDVKPNPEENIVELFWITSSEINNDYFTIEKTKDLNHYEEVVTTEGQGTTNEATEYKETDYNPYSGVSYYRLSQTDFDGKRTFFDLEKVLIDMDKGLEMDVQLYPNPNNGQNMFMKVPKAAGEELRVLVNDFLGKEVLVDFSVYDQAEHYLVAIEMSEKLQPGTYLIHVQLEDRKLSHKLIVQ